MISGQSFSSQASSRDTQTITLFLCGDVMTGRGIDQVLPYPSDPRIYEPYMTSAQGYVKIAEEASGPIPKPVDFPYIWGDALEELGSRCKSMQVYLYQRVTGIGITNKNLQVNTS